MGWADRRSIGAFEIASGQVALVESPARVDQLPAAAVEGESVALTLALDAESLPAGWSALDLSARQIRGESGPLFDSVREFCRKRGIRFTDAPWRYSGGLI